MLVEKMKRKFNLKSSEKRSAKGLAFDVLREHFDAEWYLKVYPDVRDAKVDPLKHYLDIGWKEGRNPSPNFDTDWYIKRHPDVATAGVNPLQHYVQFGRYEGRDCVKAKEAREVSGDPGQIAQNYHAKKLVHGNERALKDMSSQADKFALYMSVGEETELLSELPSGVSYLTLDIWDTVLRRKCHPDEVKFQSARYLLLNAFHDIRPAFRNALSLYKARIKSENESSLTEDFEYRFAEAVPRWLELVLRNSVSDEKREKLRDGLVRHEIAAESSAIYADAPMKRLLERHASIPKVYVSDFYLDTGALNKLLKSVGLEHHFVRGYSSCENAINKRSGELFDFVLSELDEDPNRVIHIGDNFTADVERPAERGIHTFHYQNKFIEQQRGWFGEAFYRLLDGDTSEHGARMALLCEKVCSSLSEDSALNDAAREVAPVAIGFVLNIIERAKMENVSDVFFLTREGEFLKRLYDTVVKADPYLTDYPESHLLEVSRLATFSASLRNTSIEEMMRLWNQYSIQSPASFMSSLKLDVAVFGPMFESAGFSLDEEIVYPWENAGFVELYYSERFQQALAAHIAEQKALLGDYLGQFPAFVDSQNTMVVDVGWRGTIHDNLCFMTDSYVHGVYLGLFDVLNEQPGNASKSGWLFNHNVGDSAWSPTEVAPFEMLFNARGGSVKGYLREGDRVTAQRMIIEREDATIAQFVEPIQQLVLAMVGELTDYVRLHGLTSQDMKAGAQVHCDRIISTPPRLIAEAFYQLEHNEEFGTGSADSQHAAVGSLRALAGLKGSKLHYEAERVLAGCRWPEALVRLPAVQEIMGQLSTEQRVHLPSKLFVGLLGDKYRPGMKVGFFVPGPLVGSGGHRTIFNLARKFYEFGAEIFIFLEQEGAGVEVVQNYLQETRAHIFTQWHKHFELDVAFATIAHSARFVMELDNAKHKAYLIQDFEAMFNPMGDGYHVAEQSYIYPTMNFTVGNWLTHVLKTQFNAPATPAGLGCDTATYFPIDGVKKEKAICFLYQPEKPRRSPQLAIHALRLVKRRHPDVKIYVYGSDAPINLDFEVENLGLIHDLSEINALYNKCMVGLCISMSNPSRIPYELMAAGTVPVDIYRYNNLLDFPSGTSLMAYQSEFSIAEAICSLFEDEEAYSARRDMCRSFAISRTLNWEREAMFNSLVGQAIAGWDAACHIDLLYEDSPVISERDKSLNSESFCQFQKSLSKA